MRRMITKTDPKVLLYEAQKLKLRGARLLEALERMVGTRPGEKLEVNIRGKALEETIGRAGRQIALGVIGGLALLASAMTANARGAGAAGWSIIFGATGIAAAVILAVGVARGRKP
jgi:hypothetical protein